MKEVKDIFAGKLTLMGEVHNIEKGKSVLILKDKYRKCFLFRRTLTIRDTNREWGVSPSSTAGQEWTSHHSCCKENSPKQANAADRRERWAFKVFKVLNNSRRRPVVFLHSLSPAAARGTSLDLRTGCCDALKVTEVLISSTVSYEFTQRHERYAASAFTLCMSFLLFDANIRFPCMSVSRGARCTAGWHYGNCAKEL